MHMHNQEHCGLLLRQTQQAKHKTGPMKPRNLALQLPHLAIGALGPRVSVDDAVRCSRVNLVKLIALLNSTSPAGAWQQHNMRYAGKQEAKDAAHSNLRAKAAAGYAAAQLKTVYSPRSDKVLTVSRHYSMMTPRCSASPLPGEL
jgi:hypothetical protein